MIGLRITFFVAALTALAISATLWEFPNASAIVLVPIFGAIGVFMLAISMRR